VQLSYIINQLESFGVQVDFVGSGQTEIQQVAGLDHAQSNHISFLNDKKYISSLLDTQAGAVILSSVYGDSCAVAHLIVDNPYYVYALVAQILNPNAIETGVHSDSTVDDTAVISETSCIKAQAAVHAGVVIGQSTLIGSGAIIEHDVQIGANCRIGSNVVICHNCIIGDDVIIEAGAIIGGDGFGWANHQGKWTKIPQVGRVIIGDHVSIGNNVCIDRGAIEDTVIADNCIIDNLVHIAHNVKIGEGCAIAGQVGFAGSTSLGAHCTVAGQVGFAGHLSIADNIHFLAKAGVTHNLDKPGAYAGFPAIPVSDWQKNSVRARNLDKMSKQIKQLQKQLDALSES